MKKLFVLGLGLAMFIAGMFVASLMNKPERTITDEEAVYAYYKAMGEEGNLEIIVEGNKFVEDTEDLSGGDYIVYTVYKNGEIMTFGEISKNYAHQFVE